MGRTSQKPERRGPKRPEADSDAVAEERRRRIVGAFSVGILLAATVATVILVASSGGDAGSTSAEGAFGTHYEGLEERMAEANVATMGEAGGQVHFHPTLAVYENGKQVPIPPNIGIDPANSPTDMAGLHTHDDVGTIHLEATEGTLGQFFEVWGVPFSSQQLGPHEAGGSEEVRVWVDGQPSREFGDLVLEDGQEVTVTYGSPQELPPGLER